MGFKEGGTLGSRYEPPLSEKAGVLIVAINKQFITRDKHVAPSIIKLPYNLSLSRTSPRPIDDRWIISSRN